MKRQELKGREGRWRKAKKKGENDGERRGGMSSEVKKCIQGWVEKVKLGWGEGWRCKD